MTEHPGRTPAERRILDAPGVNQAPEPRDMRSKARHRLERDGLIEVAGEEIINSGPGFEVKSINYQMTQATHMQWCDWCSEQAEKEPNDG